MQTLLTAEEIAARVKVLGEDISRDYRQRPLTVIGVLHGSIVFVADLIRAISAPHQLGFVMASSYRGEATLPGELRLDLDSLPNLAGREVLLVDDILDTGRTLASLKDKIAALNSARVRTAVLLWKKERTEAALTPDYVGFEIPDRFVVGYGLDFNGDYRHLPFIGALD